jgi:hypothetical protein
MGLDLWAIQLLGRWGGDTVRLYVRSAQAEMVAGQTVRAAHTLQLDDLVAELKDNIEKGAKPSGGDSAAPPPKKSRSEASTQVSKMELSRDAREAVVDPAPCLPEPAVQALAADLETEVSRAQAAPADRDASKVVVSQSGVWHAVLHGPPDFVMSQWVSTCGWSFGKTKAREVKVLPIGDLPADYRRLCQKCFAVAKADLKYDELRSLRRHMREGA